MSKYNIHVVLHQLTIIELFGGVFLLSLHLFFFSSFAQGLKNC